MNKITKSMKGKILNISDYELLPDIPKNVKLSDNVFLYNTGNSWKIIPLSLALTYPIIYDIFFTENQKYNITIVVCPVTLRSAIFKGLFEFETYTDYKMILKEKENQNVLIPIDMGLKINQKYIIEENKRIEIKIGTLRNIITIAPDAMFMNSKKNINPIIDVSYYNNNKDINGYELTGLIHPKTLVYVIQYKTYTEEEEKIIIILGKDMSQYNVTGYDTKKSKIFKYLEKIQNKLINNEGFIIPMLWYMAKNLYDKSDVVHIE